MRMDDFTRINVYCVLAEVIRQRILPYNVGNLVPNLLISLIDAKKIWDSIGPRALLKGPF